MKSLVTERVVSFISAFLGGTALLLAAVGLYGLVAYSVARRTSEIGLRIALGASQAGVTWLVVRDSLFLVIAGAWQLAWWAPSSLPDFPPGCFMESPPRTP